MSQQSFLSRLSGPYLVFTHFVILALAGLTLSRLALMLWQWERVQAAGNPLWMLVQGVRADLILLGLLLVIPLLLAVLAAAVVAEVQINIGHRDTAGIDAGELSHQDSGREGRERLESIEMGPVRIAYPIAVLLREPASRILVVVDTVQNLGEVLIYQYLGENWNS